MTSFGFALQRLIRCALLFGVVCLPSYSKSADLSAKNVTLFPQLIYAQNSSKAPKLGEPFTGTLSSKVKQVTGKKYVFEISPKDRKPVTIKEDKKQYVQLGKEVRVEIENVSDSQLSVTVIDVKTRKVLKKQKIQTNIKTNIIVGAKSEPRVVIILTKGTKRPR